MSRNNIVFPRVFYDTTIYSEYSVKYHLSIFRQIVLNNLSNDYHLPDVLPWINSLIIYYVVFQLKILQNIINNFKLFSSDTGSRKNRLYYVTKVVSAVRDLVSGYIMRFRVQDMKTIYEALTALALFDGGETSVNGTLFLILRTGTYYIIVNTFFKYFFHSIDVYVGTMKKATLFRRWNCI